MASKFQNRLVGTIILVAAGVIVLPGLLDGQKKHYREEFAAIPLVPKAGDPQDNDSIPPVTQPLAPQSPTYTQQAMSASTADPHNESLTPAAEPLSLPKEIKNRPAETPKSVEKSKIKSAETVKPHPAVPSKNRVTDIAKEKTAEAVPEISSESIAAPTGQAWMVQLGALRNATKVDEIVARLHLSGYRVFTIPASPVQGELTRIYVGPDASKAKMQAAISELKSLSGLNGVVKAYRVH